MRARAVEGTLLALSITVHDLQIHMSVMRRRSSKRSKAGCISREDETKTGHEVRSVLPRRLVPLLEDYIGQHRPLLVLGADPGSLFLNCRGGALTRDEVIYLVSKLTIQYKGRRVTPHLFRDIFAFWWLENHPQDYLTLSKALWHRDINTTLRIYGSRFDESHGVMRIEEWLDAGGQEEHQPASRAVTGDPAPDTRRLENITQAPVGLADPRDARGDEHHCVDYKGGYEEQCRINKHLTDRLEQLEKQLGQCTFESRSGQSQSQPRIPPEKVGPLFRKTG